MPNAYELELRKPCTLTIRSADKSREAVVDVFEAWRYLINAEKEPSREAQWAKVRTYLTSKLQITEDQVTENVCWGFHEAVIALAQAETDSLKKTAQQIVSSLQPTQASPPTSPAGPEK
jgi:S-methylmethionine-dependent homocysteine/selenocysteine methylase